MEAERQLLLGAYDLHMHAAPSPFHRLMDDCQLLQDASKAGMGGILLKSHYESTAARAAMANQYANSAATAYGSIALNWPAGGLNPYAVQNALQQKAKLVFMPTRDAANSLLQGDMPGDFFRRPGICILDEAGKLKPEVYDIMDIVKQHNAALATGHISPMESVILCKEGIQRGVRMVLSHPEYSRTTIPAATQRELADLGVWIEKCWYNIAEGECTAQQMANTIRIVGASRCFLTTDRGQSNKESPVQGLIWFIEKLLHQGILEQDVWDMTHTNPRFILAVG